ncbi:hypothetical protein GJAV_G00037020 [Gymnothorax javanicus]|nr:hypothetical protein GJAV_G00037020 [Gymnothorax javanicus]
MIMGMHILLLPSMGHTQGGNSFLVLSPSGSSTMRGQLWPSALESVPQDATQNITVLVEEGISLNLHHCSVGILLDLIGTAMVPTQDGVPPGK